MKLSVLDKRHNSVLAIVGFYFFFALLYHITLCITYDESTFSFSSFLSPKVFFAQSGLQYLIRLLLVLPIWWMIFQVFGHWSLKKRLILHLFVIPIWVVVTQQLHYIVADNMNWVRLSGVDSVWDIYIPVLFYILQFGLLHAYEYYTRSEKYLQEQAELREAVLKSELSVLKAQLNPHFLYNVFNTISASVPSTNEKTRQLIASLSDVLRYQLKASNVEYLTIKDEIEFVSNYLALEKARFENRLKIYFDVQDGIENELIPTMLLQPMVENAIKHGIAPKIDGGTVTIRIHQVEGKLNVQISDTGVGLEDHSKLFGSGVGLTNTKLRLEKMYNSALEVENNQPTGLKLSFSL